MPLPLDAMLTLPGLAFAYRMNSGTELTGSFGLITITFGTAAQSVIGAKSFTGSKGIFWPFWANSEWLIACVPTVPISTV